MTRDEFIEFQHDETRRALSDLVNDCKRRFLEAAKLVGIRSPVIKGIEDALHNGHVDMAPLLPAWEVICKRYRDERFDPQTSLFKDHHAESIELWGRFLYQELFPDLVQENEFVRNVLRAVQLLPCQSPPEAASALSHYLKEMSLPFRQPPWDGVDI